MLKNILLSTLVSIVVSAIVSYIVVEIFYSYKVVAMKAAISTGSDLVKVGKERLDTVCEADPSNWKCYLTKPKKQ